MPKTLTIRCKQAGQLASKMRVVAAPWAGLLESGAWLRNARHRNACTQRLAGQVADIPEIDLMFPVDANAVFLREPAGVLEGASVALLQVHRRRGSFHVCLGCRSGAVEALAADIMVASLSGSPDAGHASAG